MKRFILFSKFTPNNKEKALSLIFPSKIAEKIVAYLPSDGENIRQEYVDEMYSYAQRFGAEFRIINNSKQNDTEEVNNLLGSNILIISGGNTFKLLYNLRKSGLDKSIREFSEKSECVIAGFSAGALVLTPTIEICNLPDFDENVIGLEDLTGLNVVDFEVFPHYENASHKELLNNYRKSAKNDVREISDDGIIAIDL